MTDFSTQTHEEIRRLLLDENPKARISGDKINGITCPECGKHEAYAWLDQPNVIMCHRFNKCGAKTLIRDRFPQLYTDFEKRFKPTKDNPRATAEAYLQARGLNYSGFDFKQGVVTDNGKKYQTVAVSFNGVLFQRLIDYKAGAGKNRLSTYKGKFFCTKSVEESRRVYIVEGIFDAMALEQSGIPAIAVLSSLHNPETCFKSGVHYVLAFDNDAAGLKAIDKFKIYLDKKDIDFSVALPPRGKDWNDLLIHGDLSSDRKEKTLELCGWNGSLATSQTALEYFETYREQKKVSNLIFEFQKQTYKGIFKPDKKENQASVIRLLDCVLGILFSVEDTSMEYESRITHIIKTVSRREGTSTLSVRGGDFCSANDFKTKLLQYRLLFFGKSIDLSHYAEYLFDQRPIKVRECTSLGYDKKSDCFVFSKFLYDKDGSHHLIDSDGYFHKDKIKPFNVNDKSITVISDVDVPEFIADLYRAYGDKGLLALGFWVSASFSHIIFDEFGFFPFFSMYGDSHCGKSDLTTALNRIFFVDSEGLAMGSANTKKGELRVISQKSSMVTALIEGRKDNSRFDYDSILPLYNRNSLQVRAQTSNDNQTHDLKFNGALAFVQNHEQFISKPAKERVVSIHFSDKNLNDTYEAWKHFKSYSPEQLAAVGHFILKNRLFFEKHIISEINDTTAFLSEKGVQVDRIAKNHACVHSGISILMELAKSEIKDNLLDFTFKRAMKKIETAHSELPVADLFIESVCDFTWEKGVVIEDGVLIIHLPQALEYLRGSWNKSELLQELKLLDGYLGRKSSRAFSGYGSSVKKCWHFLQPKNQELDGI